MTQNDLAREIIRMYRKHGWELRKVLSKPDGTLNPHDLAQEIGTASLQEYAFDGLWFSRPSQNQREAWELRLVSENPYALFETFEADEPEDLREEARMEMEAKVKEKLGASESDPEQK